MPVTLPADLLDSCPRAPRAQFFANRALSHLRSLTSFDQINCQQSIEKIVAGPTPKQQAQAPEPDEPNQRTR